MRLLLVTALFLSSLQGFSQEIVKPDFNRWSIDGKIGVNNPVRNFTPGYESPMINIGAAGIGARYMMNAYFGMRLGVVFNRFQDNSPSPHFATNHGRIELDGIVNLGNALNFYEWTNRIGLLAHMGVGFGNLREEGFPVPLPIEVNKESGDVQDAHGIFSIGVTPQVKLGARAALNFDVSAVFMTRMNNTIDFKSPVVSSGLNSAFLEGTIGLSYYLGKSESHADWTPTKSVNKRDLDKLAEETAAMKKGMNDDDKDGVPNYLDQELETPENSVVDLKGVARPDLNDSDKDGIADAYDLCPTEKGVFSANGCPDRDKDGVADADDKCPDTPGIISEQGCAPKPQSFNGNGTMAGDAHSMVYFNTNSASLSRAEKAKLDAVAVILKANANQKVVLNGHADSSGEDNYNKNLSSNRASASKSYLVKKGISSSRISTNSFGSSQPAASNATAEGMAKNRRVEISLK